MVGSARKISFNTTAGGGVVLVSSSFGCAHEFRLNPKNRIIKIFFI
jgi:hypothetical protein